MKKSLLFGISVGAALLLSACGQSSGNQESSSETSKSATATSNNMESMEDKAGSSDVMGSMDMDGTSDTSDINRMVENKDPKFPVGTKVILKTDHMEGMDGAEATVTGAFDTTLYEVSYKPTTGGEEVKNHKWVVQEELDTDKTDLKKGDKVTLKADHMEGMDGAKATIEKAVPGTAYMVDYKPTTGGEEVKNHKWLTDDELEKA
jgi:hypothetical protein